MAAGLVAAIFSVVGLGIKQLAAVSAAELPDAVASSLLHTWSLRGPGFRVPIVRLSWQESSFPGRVLQV